MIALGNQMQRMTGIRANELNGVRYGRGALEVPAIIRIGEEVIRGLKLSRNIMPNIMRPPLQDASPGHDVKAVSGDMLRRVSMATHERRERGHTASGRSIPGRSMGKKWILGYKGESSNHYDLIRTTQGGAIGVHTWKISLYSVIQFQFHHCVVYSWM